MLGVKQAHALSIWEDFVKSLENRITEIREGHIQPLGSRMSIKKGPPGGPMKDFTQQEKKRLEADIRSIQAVLDQYRGKA